MSYRPRSYLRTTSPYHRPLSGRPAVDLAKVFGPRQHEGADHFLSVELSRMDAAVAGYRADKRHASPPQFSAGFMAARRRGARFWQGANAPRSYSAER